MTFGVAARCGTHGGFSQKGAQSLFSLHPHPSRETPKRNAKINKSSTITIKAFDKNTKNNSNTITFVKTTKELTYAIVCKN